MAQSDKDPNATPEEQARIDAAFEAQERDAERLRRFAEEMRKRAEK